MKRATKIPQTPEVPASNFSDHEDAWAPILHRGREALRLLLEAFQYGCQADRSVWEFAVEIDTLRKAGCTNNEFRWLVCRGYVEHAPETTLPDQKSRSFGRRLGRIRGQ
jgi:hypothetical protein